MIGAGDDLHNVCNGLKGRDLAYCREQVDKCAAQKPTAGSENPYKLETCAEDVFTFSKLDGCVRNVRWIIEQRGSCPSRAAVEKMKYASPDDTSECDRYTGKEKTYCLDKIGECLDYRDKFSNNTPISLETCTGGHFNFDSLYYCFWGVHTIIEQIGACPPKKLKLKNGTATVLTSSNIEQEVSKAGTLAIYVVRSLEDEDAIREINKLTPPWGWDESKGRPVIGRIALVAAQSDDGKAVVNKYSLGEPEPGQKYVKWLVHDGKFLSNKRRMP